MLQGKARNLLDGLVDNELASSSEDLDISSVALGGDYIEGNRLFNSIGRSLSTGNFW